VIETQFRSVDKIIQLFGLGWFVIWIIRMVCKDLYIYIMESFGIL